MARNEKDPKRCTAAEIGGGIIGALGGILAAAAVVAAAPAALAGIASTLLIGGGGLFGAVGGILVGYGNSSGCERAD